MTKKILSWLIAVVMVFACSAVALATDDDLQIMPAVGYVVGDVNMDKIVNIKDATTVQKYLAGLEELSDDQCILADADLDIKVTIKDATYIQKQVAGLVGPMKPEDTSATATDTGATDITAEPETPTTAVQDTAEPTELPTDFTEAPTQLPTEAPTDFTEAPTQLPSDPTEVPTEVTATDAPTQAPTEQPTTKDPNKPIELPFIPAS